jgi:hypothetical protein
MNIPKDRPILVLDCMGWIEAQWNEDQLSFVDAYGCQLDPIDWAELPK